MSRPSVSLHLTPSRRSVNDEATITGGDVQSPEASVIDPPDRYGRSPGTLPLTMAKAKRRKLRARRSKANHGRKPNAGRG
ncbi:MAG: hypothetical protein M3096_10515 [Actinomycetia bacterium]|nr:hypothetical protein [Actinomycetes bacterium]